MFTPQRDESKLFSTTMACGNSGNPTVSDDFTIDDAFLISSGKLFASFKQLESSKFLNTLADARQRVMSFLSAASRESYSRCYPALVQLHVLQEVQQAYEVHSGLFAKNKENSDHYIRNHFDWDRRFSLLSPSFKQRSKILEARRASLGIMGLRNLAAENWMMSCRALRQMGRFDTAMIALRHAEANGIGREEALLEECLLIKDTGNIRKALMLVEPDEGFLNSLRMSSIGGSNVTACVPTMSDEEINILANRLLLSTRWMHESKLAHGREIVDRFKVVLYLHKEWEDALFYLAKYNDELFESGFNDKLRTQFPAEEDRTVLIFAVTALEYYGKCMKIGSKFILQAAPKFLSVYFSIMALRGARSGSRTSSEGSALAQAQRAASDRAIKFMTEVSASKWYTCMPQIVSRAGHPSPDALKFVKGVLHNILISFPEQGIWHISCLLHSLNKERATVGRNLIRDASASLEKKRRFQSSSMLQESILLFSNLVELAHNQTKDRRIRWSIGTECQLTHFLVPSQSALTIVFPSAEELENGHGTYFPSQQVCIVLLT